MYSTSSYKLEFVRVVLTILSYLGFVTFLFALFLVVPLLFKQTFVRGPSVIHYPATEVMRQVIVSVRLPNPSPNIHSVTQSLVRNT